MEPNDPASDAEDEQTSPIGQSEDVNQPLDFNQPLTSYAQVEGSATNGVEPAHDAQFAQWASGFGRVTADSVSQGGRIWTVFGIVVTSYFVFLLGSLLMALIAFFVVHGQISFSDLGNQDKMMGVSRSRIGLVIMVVLPQLALVTPSIAAAYLSPIPLLRRLGMVRGHWPVWAWICAALTTPMVGLFSTIVVGSFMEESESLKEMTSIFRDHGSSGFLVPLALMIGATPAICEEILFRGYIQTRLTRTWHPLLGIIIASLLFAGFHMDLVHIVAVLPIGVYLGWVSWRSGSIIPAMIGHFINNTISVVAVVLAPEGETDTLALPAVLVSLAILGLGFFGLAGTVAATVAYGTPKHPEDEDLGLVSDRLVPAAASLPG